MVMRARGLFSLRRSHLLAPACALAGALACNGVLGIDEAALDPTLSDAGAIDSGTTKDGGDEAATPSNPCSSYCDAIAKNCTTTNSEYTSVSTCNAICTHFEPGVPGEQSNDSLACRAFYTQKAASSPRDFCQAAGPLAAGSCVSKPCSAFCTLASDLCGPLKLFPFTDEADCRTSCARWPYRSSVDAGTQDVGDILFAAGDTLNCRLYHLESAYEVGNPAAATTHCRHLAVDSATCHD
jgi:hypothetical protein